MPDTRVVLLPYREPAGASHLKGWVIPILGLGLLGMGTALVIALNRGVAVRPTDARATMQAVGWAMTAAGVVFIAAGTHLALVRPLYHARLRRGPGEPWRADHAWDEGGDRIRGGPSVVYAVLHAAPGLALVGLLHSPAATDLLASAEPVWSLLRWLLTALLVMGLGRGAVAAARWWKFRATQVWFRRFPFFLGETLEVDLGCGRPWTDFDHVTVTLRFVRVRHVDTPDGRTGVAEQRWAQALSFDGPRLCGNALRVSIPLPADGAATALSGQPPQYWELEVKGEAHGLDLEHRFLVPVYARDY